MTTTGAEAVFLDTNVLVYANAAEADWHARALAVIEGFLAKGTSVWISRQILREFMAVVTRPQVFSQPLKMRTVLEHVREFQAIFQVADETEEVTNRLIELLGAVKTGGRQIHDANIVATMLCHDVRTLVTDNVTDFRRFEPLIRVVPLSAAAVD
jgi:predicted nucleic acid-binding protein